MAIRGWMIDLALQRALEVREALRRAPESQRFADVVSSAFAKAAFHTRDSDFEGDPIAYFERRDIAPSGNYDASGLVAESQGLADNDVAVAVVVEIMQVGAAETCALHGNLDFRCFWGTELAMFLRSHISTSEIITTVRGRMDSQCANP